MTVTKRVVQRMAAATHPLSTPPIVPHGCVPPKRCGTRLLLSIPWPPIPPTQRPASASFVARPLPPYRLPPTTPPVASPRSPTTPRPTTPRSSIALPPSSPTTLPAAPPRPPQTPRPTRPTTPASSVAPPPFSTTTLHCCIPPKHTAREILVRRTAAQPPNNTARGIATASPQTPCHCSII